MSAKSWHKGSLLVAEDRGQVGEVGAGGFTEGGSCPLPSVREKRASRSRPEPGRGWRVASNATGAELCLS